MCPGVITPFRLYFGCLKCRTYHMHCPDAPTFRHIRKLHWTMYCWVFIYYQTKLKCLNLCFWHSAFSIKCLEFYISVLLNKSALSSVFKYPQIFYVVMELIWGVFQIPWHVKQSKSLASHLTTQPATTMASSYSSSFEGAGEVKEGFLCPLCLKDLQSFYQLQEHYEEEHSGDDRHVRGQLKSEFHNLYHSHSSICVNCFFKLQNRFKYLFTGYIKRQWVFL